MPVSRTKTIEAPCFIQPILSEKTRAALAQMPRPSAASSTEAYACGLFFETEEAGRVCEPLPMLVRRSGAGFEDEPVVNAVEWDNLLPAHYNILRSIVRDDLLRDTLTRAANNRLLGRSYRCMFAWITQWGVLLEDPDLLHAGRQEKTLSGAGTLTKSAYAAVLDNSLDGWARIDGLMEINHLLRHAKERTQETCELESALRQALKSLALVPGDADADHLERWAMGGYVSA